MFSFFNIFKNHIGKKIVRGQRTIKKYGWIRDAPDHRDLCFSPVPETINNLPSKVDLRPNCCPVFNQFELGSCTGNAIAAAHWFAQHRDNSINIIVPSRLFIYFNEREMEGTIDVDSGAQIRDGIKSIAKQGVCSEATWPYIIRRFRDRPSDQAYFEALDHQAILYSSVIQDLNQMKACLAGGYPFVFGFSVYSSFESNEVAISGMASMPTKDEKMQGGHAVLCLSGDTFIPLLDGTEKTISELNQIYGKNDFFVYSCTKNGKIVPGKAHSLRKTGDHKKIVKVILDNGKFIKCTPDHLFLMRDGAYKEAKDLNKNDSLMPLYRKDSQNKGMKGYEMVLQQDTHKWKYTHRMVSAIENRNCGTIHHKDFNKKNNNPDNLQIMTWEEHTKYHCDNSVQLECYSKSEKGREKSRELMKKLWANNEWREKTIEKNRENGKKVSKKLVEEKRCGFQAMDKEKLSKMNAETGKINWHHLQTEETQRKSQKSSRLSLEANPELRQKKNDIAIQNLSNYNLELKNGTKQLTEKQIQARKQNAKIASLKNDYKMIGLKSGWTRWHKLEYPKFEDYLESKKMQQEIPNNHKVIKVEDCGYEDVYDLTVDEYHNFATSAGVFVHNCVGYDDSIRRFIVQNSWGDKWGVGGYFYIPYDYLTNPRLASDFWRIKTVEI